MERFMFCKRWTPEELLPRVDLMSYLLKLDKRVTGVAITGSLARLEPEIHDIDLVVLHDGSMEDGSCKDPMCEGSYYNNDLLLCSVLNNSVLSRAFTQARFGVPVDFIFVGESALWDCDYLQSLAKKETYPDFYFRVFNDADVPLVLLDPLGARGALRERFFGIKFSIEKVFMLERGLPKTDFAYPAFKIRHQCNNPCRPKQSWVDCREEIKNRKASMITKVGY